MVTRTARGAFRELRSRLRRIPDGVGNLRRRSITHPLPTCGRYGGRIRHLRRLPHNPRPTRSTACSLHRVAGEGVRRLRLLNSHTSSQILHLMGGYLFQNLQPQIHLIIDCISASNYRTRRIHNKVVSFNRYYIRFIFFKTPKKVCNLNYLI